MKNTFFSLLTVATLVYAESVESIINKLKQKSGETLQNPVIFVKYGPDKFDWLAVTTDGKFAAKLEGLNPNGSFNYTILGNPEDYGIHLNVSLNGVGISSLQSSQPTEQITRDAKASLVPIFGSQFTHITQSIGVQTRSSLVKTPLLIQMIQKLHFKKTRYIENCSDGGYVNIVEISGATGTATYHNCQEMGYTFNGTFTASIYTDTALQGHIENFSIENSVIKIILSNADIDAQMDNIGTLLYMKLNYNDANVIDKTNNMDYKYKNFTTLYKYTENGYQSHGLISVEGDFYNPCTSKWYTYQTLTPIKKFVNENCPVSGAIQVTSNNDKLQIQIHDDHSIDVIDENAHGVVTHYANCLELQNDTQQTCQ